LRGKVVFLDFWSQSCPPCIAGLPHIQELYNKLKNQGLVIIAIYLQGEKDRPLNLFLKDHGITNLPVMVDIPFRMAHSQPWSTVDWYGTANRGLPSYALIDKSGKLVWQSSVTDESYKESQIEELLKTDLPN
jgi:thiol-disulfide isomerase/thioredoxin